MTQTRVTATVRTKVMPCRECGKGITVGSNTRNAPRHLECGINVGVAAMIQMKQKSGPFYERWLNGMRAFNRSLGGGREGD